MNTNTASIRVGRLLEIRADAGYKTAEDVDFVFEMIDREVAKLPPGVPVVTVADWRRCPVMSDVASKRMLERMVAINPRTKRSVAVASAESPTAVLQFVRLVRESRLSDRRMFLSEGEAIEWLDEVLTPAERTELRRFLDEGGAVSRR